MDTIAVRTADLRRTYHLPRQKGPAAVGGRAWVSGLDVVTDTQAVRERITMASGCETSGYGVLTVREDLWLFSQPYGVPRKEASPADTPGGMRTGRRRVRMLRRLFRFLRTSPSNRSGAGCRPRCRPAPEPLEGRLAPAVLTVDSPADNTAPDTVLTLREAVALVDGTLGRLLTPAEQAHLSGTLGSGDAIQFNLPAGPQTVTLTLGALMITRGVTITGPGALNLTVDGNGVDRVFVVGQVFRQDLGLSVSLSGLTIANGLATASGKNYGAGLLTFGTVTVSNVTFTGNAAGSGGGGGIYNVGNLTVTNCTFTANTVTGGTGGGILNSSSGTLTVTNCTFSGNTGTGGGQGGGLGNSGTATVQGTTFSGNTVDSNGAGLHNSSEGTLTVTNCTFTNGNAGSDGGAFDNDGTVTVSNSTFSNNTCGSEGGAIDNHGSAPKIINCTFANNSASSRGGAVNGGGPTTVINCTLTGNRVRSSSGVGGGLLATAPAQLFNTIIAGNFRGPTGSTADDVSGTLDPGSSSNLIGTGGAGGLSDGTNHNQVGVSDARLGPLADNGGPTLTVLPLPGSPALAAGSTAYVTAGETDQRGLPRVVNGAVDIGAVEVQPPAAPIPGTNPPPLGSRGITARLVAVKVRRKRRLRVEVFSADTGALKSQFASPFQRPRYKAIRVSVRDSSGDGVPDQVVLTARRGKRTMTAILPG